MYITEPERKIKIIDTVDTAVCGGGIAGIAAALSAARCGSKVMLIEREYALGGLATLGLVAIYLPIADGTGRQVSYSIAEELLRLSIKHGTVSVKESDGKFKRGIEPTDLNRRFETEYDPNVFAVTAEQLLLENGVEILYGTSVCAVKQNSSVITHLYIENRSGRSAVAVKNVIDATGDAVICKLSGENTVLFSQGNVPASWYYSSDNGANNLHMVGFSDIPDSEKTPEQKANDRSSLRFSGIDEKEVTSLMIYSHKTSLAHFLKSGRCSAEHAMSSLAHIPQLRMTRRIDGLYTQDTDEMHKEYADSVGMFADWKKIGPVYELPFSCLKGKKVKNLLCAGRCISSTDAMWDITRVIPVCAVSGQAAGTAAALFDDFSAIDIKMLQNRLEKDGVKLHERDI